jgi:hypothetical protein
VPRRKVEEDSRNRLEQYGHSHPYIKPVDVSWCASLAGHFHRSGMCMPGPVVLSWQEVMAYNVSSAAALSPWEAETIVEMSRSYVTWRLKGSQQSDMPDEVPHYSDDEEAMQALREYLPKVRDRNKSILDEALK